MEGTFYYDRQFGKCHRLFIIPILPRVFPQNREVLLMQPNTAACSLYAWPRFMISVMKKTAQQDAGANIGDADARQAYRCDQVRRVPGVVLSLVSLTLQLCPVLGYQTLDLRLHALGWQKMMSIAKPASPYTERRGLRTGAVALTVVMMPVMMLLVTAATTTTPITKITGLLTPTMVTVKTKSIA